MRAWGGRYGDYVLAAALAVIGVLEAVLSEDDASVVGGIVTVLAASVLMAWRRRNPELVALGAFAVIVVGEAWANVWSSSAWPFVLSVVLVYTIAANRDGWQAVRGLGVLAAAMALATAIDDYDEAVSDWAFVGIVAFAGPAILGWLLGGQARLSRELERRNAQLDREREERARRAVADERARIARELHDVVAHSVSVMVIQAGGARSVMERTPDKAERSFGAIESTGRDALDEMRRLLGLLRPAGEEPQLSPQPGLARVAEVVERARAAGLAIELQVAGEPVALAPGADVAAYRVVQEAITNVLKHAGGARVRVVLRHRDDDLEVEVVDDGGAQAPARIGVAGGHGLVGMRERVALQGGDFEAGPRPGGGFGVRARFPRAEVPA
jgi:signal transduction histidine kinase